MPILKEGDILTVRLVNESTLERALIEAVKPVPEGEPNEEGASVSQAFQDLADENPYDASWGNNNRTLIGTTVYTHALRHYLDGQSGISAAVMDTLSRLWDQISQLKTGIEFLNFSPNKIGNM